MKSNYLFIHLCMLFVSSSLLNQKDPLTSYHNVWFRQSGVLLDVLKKLPIKDQSREHRVSDCLCELFFQIGVKGAEAIADCLQYNATISTLDLRANSLGDDVCIPHTRETFMYWFL